MLESTPTREVEGWSVFQVSTAGAPLLINGQTNECLLDDWRGDAALPPALYKITKDGVRFDACLSFEVAIHRRGQRGTRCSQLRAPFR